MASFADDNLQEYLAVNTVSIVNK